jgi:hypothetical protein
MACDSSDDSDATIEPDATLAATLPADGSSGALEDEISSVEAVKQLVAEVSDLEPEVVEDIEVEERTLTIMLNQDDSFAESSDVESICSDVNQAIGLPDLRVVIESSSGTPLAQCTLTG